MRFRSLVLLSVAVTAFSLSAPALADIPNPTTGSGGSTSSGSTSSGGGSAPTDDPNCVLSQEQIDGTTCQECDPSSTCSKLDNTYNMVCQRTASVQIWCNGPNRGSPSDQNVSCSISAPTGAWSGVMAGTALAAAVALLGRRRRRS